MAVDLVKAVSGGIKITRKSGKSEEEVSLGMIAVFD